MDSRAAKLPRGRSYPLKPSLLAAAVEAAGLSSRVKLMQWDRYDHAFEAVFHPDGSFPGQEGDMFRVRCRAVPSANAARARQVVEAEAIPRFILWALGIERLDEFSTVRREWPKFHFSLEAFAHLGEVDSEGAGPKPQGKRKPAEEP